VWDFWYQGEYRLVKAFRICFYFGRTDGRVPGIPAIPGACAPLAFVSELETFPGKDAAPVICFGSKSFTSVS